MPLSELPANVILTQENCHLYEHTLDYLAACVMCEPEHREEMYIKIKCLFNKYPDLKKRINNPMGRGGTILARAVSNGHIEIYKLLRQYGADPNMREEYLDDNNGLWYTYPSILAADNGHLDMLKVLYNDQGLRRENFVNVNKGNSSALGSAANTEQPIEVRVQIVQFLLSTGLFKIATQQRQGTIIHGAILNNEPDMLRAILPYTSEFDLQVLSHAKNLSYLGVIESLKQDSHRNAQMLDQMYESIIFEMRKKRVDIRALQEHDRQTMAQNTTSPQISIRPTNMYPVIEYPQAHVHNSNGYHTAPAAPMYTPEDYEDRDELHQAVTDSQYDLIKYLLENDPYIQQNKERLINAYDTRGCTPLDRAAQTGNIEIFNLLLQHGAKFNRVQKIMTDDDESRSVLVTAIVGEKIDMALHIINIDKYNQVIDLMDSTNDRPIERAAAHNLIPVLDALIGRGISIERQQGSDPKLNNPLHCVLYNGRIETLEYLLGKMNNAMLVKNDQTYQKCLNMGEDRIKERYKEGKITKQEESVLLKEHMKKRDIYNQRTKPKSRNGLYSSSINSTEKLEQRKTKKKGCMIS